MPTPFRRFEEGRSVRARRGVPIFNIELNNGQMI